MERVAFRMKLKKGFEKEYKRRHDNIWPKLKELLKAEGISNYSIFLDEPSGFLFGIQNLSGESSSQDFGHNEVIQQWWEYMADIMDVNSDNSPVTIPLKELFYME